MTLYPLAASGKTISSVLFGIFMGAFCRKADQTSVNELRFEVRRKFFYFGTLQATPVDGWIIHH